MKFPDTKGVLVRFPKALIKALEEMARSHCRSVSSEIVYACSQAIDAYLKEAKSGTGK